MRHGTAGSGAVPVLDLGGADDHVPGPDLLDGLAPFLGQADPGGDDEHLSHRMDMPVGAGAGFKSDAAAAGAHGVVGGVQGIDAHGPGEKAGRALDGRLLPAVNDLLAGLPGGDAGGGGGADSGKQAAAKGEQGNETSHDMTSCQDRETRS